MLACRCVSTSTSLSRRLAANALVFLSVLLASSLLPSSRSQAATAASLEILVRADEIVMTKYSPLSLIFEIRNRSAETVYVMGIKDERYRYYALLRGNDLWVQFGMRINVEWPHVYNPEAVFYEIEPGKVVDVEVPVVWWYWDLPPGEYDLVVVFGYGRQPLVTGGSVSVGQFREWATLVEGPPVRVAIDAETLKVLGVGAVRESRTQDEPIIVAEPIDTSVSAGDGEIIAIRVRLTNCGSKPGYVLMFGGRTALRPERIVLKRVQVFASVSYDEQSEGQGYILCKYIPDNTDPVLVKVDPGASCVVEVRIIPRPIAFKLREGRYEMEIVFGYSDVPLDIARGVYVQDFWSWTGGRLVITPPIELVVHADSSQK